MKDREIQESIEKYIREGLNDHKEDQLWIEFLKQPKWCDYFMIDLHLKSLSKNKILD